MKKFFTLLFCSLWMTATVSAQGNDTGYAFADKEGNVFTESTLTCTTFEDDGWGTIMIPSNLYIKNVNADANTTVAIQANITKIDNGDVQLCFPVNCASYSDPGVKQKTATATIAQGEVKSLQTEWMPAEQGECTVVYTAIVYNGLAEKGSFAITVNYQYNTTGIANARIANASSKSAYDLAGRRLSQGKRGLSIVRMADGTIRKVVR